MTKRPVRSPETPPSILPIKAIPLLEEQLERLKKIHEKRPIDERTHTAWESFIRELLIKSFGSGSKNIDDVLYADEGPISIGASPAAFDQSLATKLANQVALLQGCIDQLKLEAKIHAEQAEGSPLDKDRADLLEIILARFAADASLFDVEQFTIDNQDKYDALQSLFRDGTLDQGGGKLNFSHQSYITSKFWPKDEAFLSQLLPIMKKLYSEKKDALHEVSDLSALLDRAGLIVGGIDIERALCLFDRFGLLGGRNLTADGGIPRFKNFAVSRVILGVKSIKDYVRQYLRPAAATGLPIPAKPTDARPDPINNKVFIVHGHDDKARDDVAALIKMLGLEPIILHEKANQGMTLVEKFLKHSDVGFAVIVMTADDLGKAKTEDTARPRARQNVVFEWGYFVGSLGRDHVCALYEKGIDPPSDLHGIVYIALDMGGHWRFDILKELKAAGYSVDANKLLE